MATDQNTKIRLENLQALARSRNGVHLIAWVEQIVRDYADIRNSKPGVSNEARAEACNIIEGELLSKLRNWRKLPQDLPQTGDDLE